MIAAAILALLTVGCRPGSSGGADELDTFTWGVKSKIRTFDPAEIDDETTGYALGQIYEPLMRVGAEGRPEGVLVNSLTPNDAVTEFTANIRRGIVFSDGTTLDANVVVASFDRILKSKALRADYARNLLKDVKRIYAKDQESVVFELKRPMASLPSRLTYPALAVVPMSVPRDRPISKLQEMHGTGPFTPTEATPTSMTLVRRTNWHDQGPFLKTVRILVIEDPVLRARKAIEGDLDLAPLAPSEAVAAAEDAGLRRRLRRTPRTALVYLQLQPKSYPALKDPRVRRAIWHAIDRDRLVDGVQRAVNLRADGFVPPGVAGNDRVQNIPGFDVDRARELVARAGYRPSYPLPPISVAVATSSNMREAAEAIASDLRVNLGVEANVEALPAEVLQERNRAGKLPFYITGWTGDFEHPENYLPMLFGTGSSENRSGFSDPRVDRLFARAAPLETILQRDGLYDRAHRIIIEQAAAVPLFFPVDVEMVDPRVRGLTFSAYGHGSLGSVTKRPRT